jgi:hypothetical protein
MAAVVILKDVDESFPKEEGFMERKVAELLRIIVWCEDL